MAMRQALAARGTEWLGRGAGVRFPAQFQRWTEAGRWTRLVFGAVTVALVASAWGVAAPRDYRALRYAGVIGQTDWYTCGPASAATLLHHYFGIPATEGELLDLAVQVMTDAGGDPQEGISALALMRALAHKGLPARGYRVSLEDLMAYFQQGGLPVILHVTRPEPHYVVAVGAVGPYVLLADPSWGRGLVFWQDLNADKGFTGTVLVPVPPPELVEGARARQQEALSWAADRWERLERWGGGRL